MTEKLYITTEDIMQIYNKLINQNNTSNYNNNREQKWITFTYTGNYIRKITNLFKDINLKIAFKTTSNLNNLLNTKITSNIYDRGGIYI
jgi:hypothetical protein